MAKVIVPKNYVYSHTQTVSGITASTVLGSTYTTNFQLDPEFDTGILGFNITVNYGMSNSTASYRGTSSINVNKYITIKNSYPFGCNFIILTVKNLPTITNTGTMPGSVRLRLALSDNSTYITLSSNSVAGGSRITIPNQTYYVDLVNNTASTDASSLTYDCNKAVTYNSSCWRATKEIYASSSSSTSYSITPKNPHPYIFNNIEFRGPNYSTTGSTKSVNASTDVVINIDTSNNPSYVFLNANGLPTFINTNTSLRITIRLYVSISGSRILISSTSLKPGFAVAVDTSGTIYIDVINKKLIGNGSDIIINKAITHL